MSIPGLTIIGERINPGFKSSKKLLDCKDIEGIKALALNQVEKGADFLTINVGEHPAKDPDFLISVIKEVQNVVDTRLAFDSPDPVVQEICMNTYDPEKANGQIPILNSITEERFTPMLDLLRIQPFKIVFLDSERFENGQIVANKSADEVYKTAKRCVIRILDGDYGLTPDDIYVDVSLGPIGSDYEGLVKMAIDGIKKIGGDPDLKGIHMIVGLSNLSVMLPKRAVDGSALKVDLESSFLTMTIPHGLDTILGTAGKNYRILPDDNFILKGFSEAIALDSYDTIMRIQELYRENL
jgi:5-methyltetrahydrofolate--homocysteine methyltransferase